MDVSSNTQQASSIDPKVRKKNRRTLLLVLATFLAPALLAFISLQTELYKLQGTSNNGELIQPVIEASELSLSALSGDAFDTADHGRAWWFVYVMPSECNSACKNSLYQMRQAHIAIGPDQHRVKRLMISHGTINDETQEWIDREFPEMIHASASMTSINQSLQAVGSNTAEQGHVYLMDTRDNLFMWYPGLVDEQESIMQGKQIVKDLKRMLKVSRIG